MVLESGNHIYMLLPGPPKEMEPMFLQLWVSSCFPQDNKSNEKIVSRVLRFFGIGEAALETEIVDLIEHKAIQRLPRLQEMERCTLRLTAKHHG